MTTPFAPADGRGGRRDVARADVQRRRRDQAPPENVEAQMRAWLPGVASTRCTQAATACPSGATASAAETTGPAPAPASIGAAGSHAACAGALSAASSVTAPRTARSDTLRKRRIGDLSVVRAPSLSSTTAAGGRSRGALATAGAAVT